MSQPQTETRSDFLQLTRDHMPRGDSSRVLEAQRDALRLALDQRCHICHGPGDRLLYGTKTCGIYDCAKCRP